MSYVYLTPSDKQYIADNHKLSNVKIAEWIGCSPAAVANQRKKLGLPPSKIRWDDADVNKLVKLLHDGLSIKEIAAAFGTTRDNIYVRIRILKRKYNGNNY